MKDAATWLAVLKTTTNYYPFGMEMPGRKSGEMKHGYNGQLKDPELWGGALGFKYRVEDNRLGRFFSVDPLAPDYPFWSPYQFAGNCVVRFIELEGLELGVTQTFYGGKTDPELAQAEVDEVAFNYAAATYRCYAGEFKHDITPAFGTGEAQTKALAMLWNSCYSHATGDGHYGATKEHYDYAVRIYYVAAQVLYNLGTIGLASNTYLGEFTEKWNGVTGTDREKSIARASLLVDDFEKKAAEIANAQAGVSMGNTGGSPRGNTDIVKAREFQYYTVRINGRIQVRSYSQPMQYAEIIVDENLSPKVAGGLSAKGYNVKTFPKGTLDGDIIKYARENGAIVMTNNVKDFKGPNAVDMIKVSERLKMNPEEIILKMDKLNERVKAGQVKFEGKTVISLTNE